MDAVTGIWSAQVPAIVTNELGHQTKAQAIIIYASSEPLRLDVLLGKTSDLSEYTWRINYNLFYGPFKEITLYARKSHLAVTIPCHLVILFLDSLMVMRQIGADHVPQAWDELLDRLRKAS